MLESANYSQATLLPFGSASPSHCVHEADIDLNLQGQHKGTRGVVFIRFYVLVLEDRSIDYTHWQKLVQVPNVFGRAAVLRLENSRKGSVRYISSFCHSSCTFRSWVDVIAPVSLYKISVSKGDLDHSSTWAVLLGWALNQTEL